MRFVTLYLVTGILQLSYIDRGLCDWKSDQHVLLYLKKQSNFARLCDTKMNELNSRNYIFNAIKNLNVSKKKAVMFRLGELIYD